MMEAGELNPDFSSEGAIATPWAMVRERLDAAKVYWLSTVRPDGRPHVTPIAGVWVEEVLYFTTGPTERKAKNLARNLQCVVTTGTDALDGLDVVMEGHAIQVTDIEILRRVAEAYRPKYGDLFSFEVRDGVLRGEGSDDSPLAYELHATTAFAFGKGAMFSQTRYRFSPLDA